MAGKRIYLACPYSHPDPAVREARYAAANKAAAELMLAGHIVFSPLSHSHPISEAMGNGLDCGFWLRQDMPFLEDWADELRVLRLEGWGQSFGVRQEMDRALALNKPIRFVES